VVPALAFRSAKVVLVEFTQSVLECVSLTLTLEAVGELVDRVGARLLCPTALSLQEVEHVAISSG
jgi:hypothetical protein